MIIVLVLLISTSFGFGGTFDINPKCIPVCVQQVGTNVGGGNYGSGVYVRIKDSIYLVTAKHVLYSQSSPTNGLMLRNTSVALTSYYKMFDGKIESTHLILDMPFLENNNEVRYSKTRDIVLIRIKEIEKVFGLTNLIKGITNMRFPEAVFDVEAPMTVFDNDNIRNVSEIDLGGSTYIFGYPISLTWGLAAIYASCDPLLRKGVVSGVNLPLKTILIDCPAFGGNSGGPVIQYDKVETEGKVKIIGIVTSTVLSTESRINTETSVTNSISYNSGYTIVEPIEVALEIAWK